VSVKYRVINGIIDGYLSLLDGGGDADVLRGIRGLGKGTILTSHGGDRGGPASP